MMNYLKSFGKDFMIFTGLVVIAITTTGISRLMPMNSIDAEGLSFLLLVGVFIPTEEWMKLRFRPGYGFYGLLAVMTVIYMELVSSIFPLREELTVRIIFIVNFGVYCCTPKVMEKFYPYFHSKFVRAWIGVITRLLAGGLSCLSIYLLFG